jgi:hypothetical protein
MVQVAPEAIAGAGLMLAVIGRPRFLSDGRVSAGYKSDRAVTLGDIGALHEAANRLPVASAAFREAITLLEGLTSPDPDDYYKLACYHSQLAEIAGKSSSKAAADRARSESDRAMNYLRRAVDTGFRIRPLMAVDHDLDALPSRADFKDLMMDVYIPDDVSAR